MFEPELLYGYSELRPIRPNHFCRLCLFQIPHNDFINIFSRFSETQDKLIVEIVQDFANIEIWRDDTFSKLICFTCLQRLANVIEFKALIRNSDFKLKTELQSSQEPPSFSNVAVIEKIDLVEEAVRIKEEPLEPAEFVEVKHQVFEHAQDPLTIEQPQPQLNVIQIPPVKAPPIMKEPTRRGRNAKSNKEVVKAKTAESTSKRKGAKETGDEVEMLIKPKCKICGKTFARNYTLKWHMYQHNGLYPFRCSYCDKGCQTLHYLKRHEVKHKEDRPHQCAICGKAFKHLPNLIGHQIVHSDLKPFKCDRCGKEFKKKANLKYHSLRHTGERTIGCKICKKSFYMQAELRRHLKHHKPNPGFPCLICGKILKYNASLQLHMRIHSQEKYYNCNVCQRRFRSAGLVKIHIRTHLEDKPYSCSMCDKRFSFKGTLFKHRRVHTGEKPFQCAICYERFGFTQHLNRHLKLHHLSLEIN